MLNKEILEVHKNELKNVVAHLAYCLFSHCLGEIMKYIKQANHEFVEMKLCNGVAL